MIGRRSRGLTSSHTLEWERLPQLGADRHAGRDRVWRLLYVILPLFWMLAGAAIAIAVKMS
jgi:hypothetical protein